MAYHARVRRAQPGDESQLIVRLWRSFMLECYPAEEIEFRLSTLSDAAICTKLYPSSNPEEDLIHSFVVENISSNEILGFASVRTHRSYDNLYCGSELLWFYVDASHRNHGYGGQIMKFVKSQYEDCGLYVRIQRLKLSALRKVWKRWGFQYRPDEEAENINEPAVLVWSDN